MADDDQVTPTQNLLPENAPAPRATRPGADPAPSQDKILGYVTPTVAPNEQYPDPMKTEQGRALQDQVNQYQEALKQQLLDTQSVQQRFNDFDQRYRSGMEEINKEISDIDRERAHPPELTPLNQRTHEQLNAQNQLQWSWPAKLGVLGVMLAGFMGKRGHGAMSNLFLGNFLQAYAAGQEERQKEMQTGWLRTNEEIYKENQQRIEEYKAKLSDQRFDLSTKIDLMKNLADMYKDLPMQKALATQNLTNIKTALTQAERGLHDYQKEYLQTWKEQQYLTKQNHMDGYQQELANIFRKIHGYAPQTQADYQEAAQYYSPHQYFVDHTKLGGTDIKGNLKGPTLDKPLPKDSATPQGSATPAPSQSPAQPAPGPREDDKMALHNAVKDYFAKQLGDNQ